MIGHQGLSPTLTLLMWFWQVTLCLRTTVFSSVNCDSSWDCMRFSETFFRVASESCVLIMVGCVLLHGAEVVSSCPLRVGGGFLWHDHFLGASRRGQDTTYQEIYSSSVESMKSFIHSANICDDLTFGAGPSEGLSLSSTQPFWADICATHRRAILLSGASQVHSTNTCGVPTVCQAPGEGCGRSKVVRHHPCPQGMPLEFSPCD